MSPRSKKFLLRVFTACLPENRLFDTVFSFCLFTVSNRRLPSRRGGLMNDRLFRLLVSDEMREPVRRALSDKARCKDHVAAIVGASHVVPSLAVLDGDEAIDAYAFPDDCCIKPTHSCGKVIIRRGGAPVDRDLLKAWTRDNYYARTREANYRGLPGRIIVEPILFPASELLDYRFLCVDGQPRLVNVDGMLHGRKVNAFLDLDWRALDLVEARIEGRVLPPRPGNLLAMIALARRIAAGFSFIRVDMYTDESTILIGEVTNCHGGARRWFPHRADEIAISALLGGESAAAAAWCEDRPYALQEA